jgi:hypothetical protein
MYIIGASYLERVSLDLIGGTEISSILNLILWFYNILIHSIILLLTNKYLTNNREYFLLYSPNTKTF